MTEIMTSLPKLPGGEKVVLPLLQVLQLEVESGADHTTLRQTNKGFDETVNTFRSLYTSASIHSIEAAINVHLNPALSL